MKRQKASSSTGSAYRSSEDGQASVLLILILGTFLLAALAFAVDLSGMWFHRQSAQSAADAACLAGATDMLARASGVTPPSAGFTTGTAGDCSTASGASICQYAKFNGYNGVGLSSTTASNSVSWTFPTSVGGVTAPSGTTNPFLQVVVTENVKTWFMGILGTNYQQVAASCTCGLVSVKSAPPLLVLNPTDSGTLSTSGNGRINIVDGPARSIQVNSASSSAVSSAGNAIIDTSAAGPNGTGGDVAVVGGPANPPTAQNARWLLGTTGNWINPTLPIPDPYAGVPAPTKPANAPPPATPATIKQNTDGCPNTFGCYEYSPGYYPSGISVGANDTAIFKAGIYYMDGDFNASANSTIRNAYVYAGTPQLDGVMFYFNTGSVKISGNSGQVVGTSIPSAALKCNSSSPGSASIPANLNGNILWSQCVSNGTYYGAGSSDTLSSSGSRGLLIFNAHSNSSTPTTTGNGQLLFSGVFYFHSTANDATWNISGNGGSNTYLVGQFVTDKLTMSGNGSILLSLNPALTTNVLKVAILQ
jgi:hypothetical protein